MNYYKAFGLNISSDLYLPQLIENRDFINSEQSIDIQVSVKDLSGVSDAEAKIGENGRVLKNSKDSLCFEINDIGRFEISQGKDIFVHACEGVSDSSLSLYITGHCFGCLLAQRDVLALHGSCVCKDGKAIIISGYSGAGKSTLAAEFVSHGWKIMSDDIVVIDDTNGEFSAVSSFPSQKLWQDAVDYYDYNTHQLTPVKQEKGGEKFNIDISDKYYEGSVPLAIIIKLTHKDETCSITEYFGMDKINKIIRNIYLKRSLNDEIANIKAINTAVQLAGKVRLFYVKRSSKRESSKFIFKEITKLLEGETNEA